MSQDETFDLSFINLLDLLTWRVPQVTKLVDVVLLITISMTASTVIALHHMDISLSDGFN